MSVCEARNCKKRELCMKYTENYFKYNPTHDWVQLIDWSSYGSGGFGQTEDGVNLISRTYDCGDNSICYPMFEPIPLENKKEIMESLSYIEGQLEYGYIDLGTHDENELKIIKQVIEEYKINHGLTKVAKDLI